MVKTTFALFNKHGCRFTLPLNNFQSGLLLLPTSPYEFQKIPLHVVSSQPKPQKNAGDSPHERLVCKQSREIGCAPACGRV